MAFGWKSARSTISALPVSSLVQSERYAQINDVNYRKQLDELASKMTFLEGEDIANPILFALKLPERMDVAEVFVLPSEQGLVNLQARRALGMASELCIGLFVSYYLDNLRRPAQFSAEEGDITVD